MTGDAHRLDRITLAVTDMPPMVEFYNRVFGANLHAASPQSDDFYTGKLAGLDFLMCSNAIAQVNARQNRHQLRFTVSDVEYTLAAAITAGGTQQGDIFQQNGQKFAAVRDPDGNTIEFIQPV